MEMHLYTDNTKIKLKIKNPTQLSKECRLIDQRSHILGFVTFTNQIKELISSSTLWGSWSCSSDPAKPRILLELRVRLSSASFKMLKRPVKKKKPSSQSLLSVPREKQAALHITRQFRCQAGWWICPLAVEWLLWTISDCGRAPLRAGCWRGSADRSGAPSGFCPNHGRFRSEPSSSRCSSSPRCPCGGGNISLLQRDFSLNPALLIWSEIKCPPDELINFPWLFQL